MQKLYFSLLISLIVACGVCPAFGQVEADTISLSASDGPARGVVWEMPAGVDRAIRDLMEMHRIGVTAIRTGLIRNRDILGHADTLGIDLYVDLPLQRLPTRRLLDTLDYATAVLDTLMGLAQIHPSLRHIGLARQIDVTDEGTCGALEQLARHAKRRGPPGLRVYYLTRFTDSDICVDAVDFVLVDVRDRDDPIAALRARATLGAMGVGALGRGVRSDTLRGLSVPSSPEAQARFLEKSLTMLLSDTLSFSPHAVFVHRWRDIRRAYPSSAYELESPYGDRYGLKTIEGVERPAYDVVRGIYTNRQAVFAFSRGERPAGAAPWTTLFGWAVVVLLGTFYALSPRFRHMLPRYFAARFFYRDAVREGRDVLFGASTVLLIAVSAAFGLTLAVMADVLRATEPFVTAVYWLPSRAQEVVITLLVQPLVLAVLAGCVYAVAMILWTTVLSLLSKRRFPIAPGQALMLVVWPRWPLLIVMLAAMVVASMDDAGPTAVLVVAGSWATLSLLAAGRALIDFMLVTRVPAYVLIPALLLNPGVVAAAMLALLVLPIQPEIQFLWNMVTKS